LPNQPPQIVGELEPQTALVNQPITLDLSAYESDADPADTADLLTWSVLDVDETVIQRPDLDSEVLTRRAPETSHALNHVHKYKELT
jgi:hypothetical protein